VAGDPSHDPDGTSSPPMCSVGEFGNSSASVVKTASRNGIVVDNPGTSTLFGQPCTLTAVDASSGSRSSGTATSAAWQCPGTSASGTRAMPSASARCTHRLISALVYARPYGAGPEPHSGESASPWPRVPPIDASVG